MMHPEQGSDRWQVQTLRPPLRNRAHRVRLLRYLTKIRRSPSCPTVGVLMLSLATTQVLWMTGQSMVALSSWIHGALITGLVGQSGPPRTEPSQTHQALLFLQILLLEQIGRAHV